MLLIIVWSLITALFYKLGKRSIANLSDQKLTEVLASRFFTKLYLSSHNALQKWQYVVIVLSMLIIVGGSFFVAEAFVFIQKLIFNTDNGYFIGHDIYLFFVVVVGLGFGGIAIMILNFIRNTPNIPYEKWDNYPEIDTVYKQIKGLRNRGFLISLMLQLAFLFGMMDYTIIEKNSIIKNSLGSFTEQVIEMSAVEKATLTYHYRTETSTRSTKSRKVLEPQFTIQYSKNTFNIWSQTIELSDSIIEKIAKRLYYNGVEIDINYPGIIEKSKWRKTYQPEKFQRIMGVYDYVTMLTEGTSEPIKSGRRVRVKHLEVRLDSALYSNQYNIFKSLKDEFLLTYFTVTNHKADTSYFGTLLSLHAIDIDNKKYNLSTLIKDFGDSAIPPKSTVHLMRGFDIPKDKRKGLKVRCRPTIMNEQYIYFELE